MGQGQPMALGLVSHGRNSGGNGTDEAKGSP